MEILCLISCLWPSFTPKSGLRKVPIIGGNCNAVQSIYVERSNTPEAMEKLIATLINRQEAIEYR